MSQFIFPVQNGFPSYPVADDHQTVGEKEKRTSVFIGHLKRQLSGEGMEKESVMMTDEGQEAEQNELIRLLQAEDWEDVPEVFELLALYQEGNVTGEIMPVNLTASFGEEPIESVLTAVQTLTELTGIKVPENIQMNPPDEKSLEMLVSILQQSLGINDDVWMDSAVRKPLQMILKWSKLAALAGTVNGTEPSLLESKEKLANALDKWSERIGSLFTSAQGTEKDQKSKTDSSSLHNMPRDSSFGLRSGMPEMAVNQTILAKDLQRMDSGPLIIMKNGQPVESNEWMKQLDTILSKAKLTSFNGLQRLQIQLAPEHLGTLQIEMIKKNGQITASIIANTQQGKEILDSHLNHLKMTLSNQGIQMDRIILQDAQAAFDETLKDHQQRKDQDQELLKEEEELEMASFLDELQQLLINETI